MVFLSSSLVRHGIGHASIATCCVPTAGLTDSGGVPALTGVVVMNGVLGRLNNCSRRDMGTTLSGIVSTGHTSVLDMGLGTVRVNTRG